MFTNEQEQELFTFENALNIPEPWYVTHHKFDTEQKQLYIHISYRKRALFTCSGCGAIDQPVYDIADHDRIWRHLNFFQYPCYLHADHPRTKCSDCKKILRVNTPWAFRPGVHFTKEFDAYIMTLAKDMPMNAISRIVKEHDTRLWRILHYYVDHAIDQQDLSDVTQIGTDETSSKRGHNYMTIFMDAVKKTSSV